MPAKMVSQPRLLLNGNEIPVESFSIDDGPTPDYRQSYIPQRACLTGSFRPLAGIRLPHDSGVSIMILSEIEVVEGPRDRFITYDESDDWYLLWSGLGKKVTRQTKTEIHNAAIELGSDGEGQFASIYGM